MTRYEVTVIGYGKAHIIYAKKVQVDNKSIVFADDGNNIVAIFPAKTTYVIKG